MKLKSLIGILLPLLRALLILILHEELLGFAAAFSPHQRRPQIISRRHSLRRVHSSSLRAMNMNDTDRNALAEGGDGRIIHWGIVGLGDVCTVKAGPAFWKCQQSTLSAVMRRTPGAAKDWVERNASNMPSDVATSMRAYDSVREMILETSKLDRPLDAIYVASPPGAHLDNVREIVEAVTAVAPGSSSTLRAVYVEKPCGRAAWETRAMIDELRSRSIEFFPAYVSRAHERTQVLRRLLSVDRVCGDKVTGIRYTQRGSGPARGLDGEGGSIPWRLDARFSGGGLIMDMGCHVLDRLDYLFGPIESVKSTVLRKGGGISSYPLVEDYVSMSGTIGRGDWSAIPSEGANVKCVWDFSPKEGDDKAVDELVISGPEGSLVMGGMGAGLPVEILDAGGRVIDRIEFDAPQHAAQPLIQAVVNELLSNSPSGSTNTPLARSPARGDNAVRTSEVLDAILGSYYGGRHDEFWLRPDTWPGLNNKES